MTGRKKQTSFANALTSVVSRKNLMVSSRSAWPNVIWYLDNESPGQNSSIGWEFVLPNGKLSTDDEHTILLESFREVFYGLLKNLGSYGKPLSPGSAPRFSAGMRELFRWMVLRGYRSFSQLDEEAHYRYRNDIPIILASRNRFYGAVLDTHGLEEVDPDSFVDDIPKKYCKDEVDEAFTYGQVAYRVNILYYIFSLTPALKARGLPAMKIKPFGSRSAGQMTQSIARHTIKRIPPLPDEIAVPLLTEALAWIDYKFDDVLELQENFLRVYESNPSEARKLIKNFRFCNRPMTEIPWRENIIDEIGYNPRFGETYFQSTQVLRRLIFRARDAAVIILQYMVGLRVGEICSIKGGWDYERNFPSCIVQRFSKSSMLEMFFVRGIVSKGVSQPREDEWLIGCRPVGSIELPAPVRALIKLEKLYRPWRTLGKKDSLLVSFSQPKSLPKKPESIGDITSEVFIRGTKEFVFSEVDLSKLPDTNEIGEDLAMYRDSKGMCIRTHQGRKTFAAYALETRTSLLRPVSQHFKHFNIAITESAYFSKNRRLKDETESIRVSATVAFFVEALQGKKVYGRMAEPIAKYFASDEWNNISDYAEIEHKVAALVITHDLRIFFADHGACLIRANPVLSRCQEVGGGARWDKTSPNYIARSPGMCAGCGCFALDKSHLPFWQQRADELLKIVAIAAGSGRGREFWVHKARSEQARKLLHLFEKDRNGPAAH